jgi:hypothetical protein
VALPPAPIIDDRRERLEKKRRALQREAEARAEAWRAQQAADERARAQRHREHVEALEEWTLRYPAWFPGDGQPYYDRLRGRSRLGVMRDAVEQFIQNVFTRW